MADRRSSGGDRRRKAARWRAYRWLYGNRRAVGLAVWAAYGFGMYALPASALPWITAAWVAWSTIGVAVASWGYRRARRRWNRQRGWGWNGARGIVSEGNIRREAIRIGAQLSFLIIGVGSVLQILPPRLFVALMMSAQAGLVANSVFDEREVVRVNAELDKRGI